MDFYYYITNFYNIIKIIFYILLFIIIFGLNSYAPNYLDELNVFIQIFISLFLIYRFNPITSQINELNSFDKSIVFDSALYLLSSSIIIRALEIFRNKINYFKNLNKTNKKKTKQTKKTKTNKKNKNKQKNKNNQ